MAAAADTIVRSREDRPPRGTHASQIVTRRGAVRLDFIHGIRLSDPQQLLQGDARSKRHILIRDVADAGRPEIAEPIREASELDPSEFA
jgi:hypothetical protein